MDLPAVQPAGDRHRRFCRAVPLGVHLPDEIRRRAPGHLPGHAPGVGAGSQRQPRLRRGFHHRLLHGGAGRRHHRSQPVGGAGDGSGCAGPFLHRGGDRRPGQPGGRAGRGADRRNHPGDRHQCVSGDRAGGALPDRGRRAPGAPRGTLRPDCMSEARSPLKVLFWAVPIGVLLVGLPWLVDSYQTILLAYGLVMAIAVLGFNLLLGYTGLLSFGHSAYFGVGAYSVAFMVKYLHVQSMELFVLGAIAASIAVTLLFGYVCVRYTKIFFSILTLALSQVLWSLAFKFFWVTGGTDGLRVPTPKLLGVVTGEREDKIHFLAHGYYYYVLAVFALCVAAMWVIVHSPFGKALQAIRDNETRARFVGIQIRRYRLVAFLVSGVFTGIAGALWVPLNGLTTPDILYWPFSGEIVFMSVLGGFRNFTGPIVGAVVFNYLKTYAIASTEYWQLLLGVVLVVLVMVLPTGIVGTVSRLAARLVRRP